MLKKDEKLKVLKKIQEDVYADYIKNMSVYTYLKDKHKKEFEEDTEKLSNDLKVAREEGKIISENEKTEDAKEPSQELKDAGIKVAELEGRIDFVNKAKDTIAKVSGRVNEVVIHYENLEKWIDKVLDVKKV